MRRYLFVLFTLVACGPALPAASADDDACALPADAPPDAACPEGCERVAGKCRQQRGIIVED